MVRRKHRYFLCEIVVRSNKSFYHPSAAYMLSSIIKKAIQLYHGDYGIALSRGLSVWYFTSGTNMVLVRTMRSCHQMVLSSMSLMKQIGEYEGFFRTLHIGGTIRSCQKFLIKYHRKQMSQALRECKSDDEREKVQSSLIAACARMENIEEEDFDIEDFMGEKD